MEKEEEKVTRAEAVAAGVGLLWLLLGAFVIGAIFCGCSTKTRNVEVDGMFASDTGTLAIGSVDVIAAPVGEESATIRYDEDNAWLSPSMKLHAIRILLTGTNSVAAVTGIVESICRAFVPAAAIINGAQISGKETHDGPTAAPAATDP